MTARLVNPAGEGAAGLHEWGMTRDDDGHRMLWVTHLVETDDVRDGPFVVFNTPGLPLTGSVWGHGNDLDFWAKCTPKLEVKRYKAKPGDPSKEWTVKNFYSTKPLRRCQDESIEDPLLEPQRVSGSFTKRTELISQDKDGNAIRSSSHERLLGPNMEFDKNRPTVSVSQNVTALGLDTFAAMVDTLNDAPLWGLAVRSVKLSDVSWERLIYGTCDYYYRRTFEFDIDFSTFDRTVYDEGTLKLKDGGDKNDPRDFELILDEKKGNPVGKRFLDGNGALAASEAAAVTILVQYYTESNFLILGIPTTL